MFYSSWLCVYDDMNNCICSNSLDILFDVLLVSLWICAHDD